MLFPFEVKNPESGLFNVGLCLGITLL